MGIHSVTSHVDRPDPAAALDSLSSHVAVLASDGTIVAVNDSWIAFGRANGLASDSGGVGSNYFKSGTPGLTDDDEEAARIFAGLQDVLAGDSDLFESEYPCHSPDKQRWFRVRAVPLHNDTEGHVVVSHDDITRTKIAEIAWKEAEIRYKALLSHVPGTVYLASPDNPGNVIYQSRNHPERLGYSPEEWRSTPRFWEALLHPDDRERLLENDLQAVASGEPFTIEYRYVNRAGDIVWMRDSAILVRDADGTPLHWMGIALDITDHKNIELALQASQEQFRSAFEDASIAMCITTLDHRYVRVNQPYCDLFGGTAEEIMSVSVTDRIHPDDYERALADRDALVAGKIPYFHTERRLLRLDGSVIQALLGVSIIHDSTGEKFLLSQIQDITDRKAMENSLREATETLKSVVKASPIAILVSDLNHNVIEWNPMAEKLFGWTAEEVLGKPSPAMPANSASDAAEVRERVLSGEVLDNVEVQRLRKDGSILDLSLSAAPIRGADGSVRGGMAMFVDLTSRKMVEAARARRARLLGMVSGTVGMTEILDSLCELVETEIPGSRASIMLLDSAGERLYHKGGGSLPISYLESFDGTLIGPNVGSCGAAAWRKEPVIVADIETDPVWANFRELALQHGLRSCWSVPILSDTDHALGSFGVYSSEERLPTDQEMETLLGASHLARIAIERKLAEERVRESEELFRSAFESAATGLAFVGFDGVFLRVNPVLCDMVGYSEQELIGRNYREITHPDDIDISEETGDDVQYGHTARVEFEKRYIHRDGHIVWVNMTTSVIRDEHGEPLYHITQMHDITPRKHAEEAVRQSEERFRGLIQNAADIIGIVDRDLIIIYESPSVEPILGFTPEELVGQHVEFLMHPEDLQAVGQFADSLMEYPGKHLPLLYRARHKSGGWRWLEAEVTNLFHVPGIEGLVVNARDITDRLAAEEAMRASEERFRSAFDDASVAMAILGLDDTILRVNEAMCELSGYQEQDIVGKRGIDLSHPDDVGFAIPYMARVIAGEMKSFQMEHRYIHRDGSTVWGLVNISAARDADGQPMHLLAQIQDITERKLLEQNLHHQAYHDTLTGLPNRAMLLDHLSMALTFQERSGNATGLLFLDLDNFKIVNDSLGHVAGDDLLVQLAGRLLACVRGEDTVARLGGDEFAILIRSLPSAAYAVDIAQRVIRSFEDPFHIQGRQISASPSIGIVISETGDTPDEVLRQADVAMYRAKALGRNRIELFDSEMHADAMQRLELEHDLRIAVNEQQFTVYYQPTIDIQKRAICGVEALVRWIHPERGIVPPDEFISLAEGTGLILPLGHFVLLEACRQGQKWVASGYLSEDSSISVNISGLQFAQHNLVRQIRDVLDETGLAPHQLVLEMTETVLMDDIDESVERLDELSDLGVRIAIDDFGTGYSSLSYLRRFPVDLLKIDRSFVARLTTSSADTAIVNAIVSLGSSLGIRTVAEGVETPAQLEHLAGIGCHWAQGYLFARPEPAAVIGEVLYREVHPHHH